MNCNVAVTTTVGAGPENGGKTQYGVEVVTEGGIADTQEVVGAVVVVVVVAELDDEVGAAVAHAVIPISDVDLNPQPNNEFKHVRRMPIRTDGMTGSVSLCDKSA